MMKGTLADTMFNVDGSLAGFSLSGSSFLLAKFHQTGKSYSCMMAHISSGTIDYNILNQLEIMCLPAYLSHLLQHLMWGFSSL